MIRVFSSVLPPIRALAVAVLAVVASSCGAAPPPAASPAEAPGTRLVLMGTTDIHGWLLPHDYYSGASTRNGLMLLAPIIDSVRVANPGRTVLLDSGDLLQGNPLNFVHRTLRDGERHPVIAAMNALEYDAAAIGNHEYNYGIPHLRQAVGQADFPFLSANTFRAGTGERAFEAYTIVERTVAGRPVRIGITGVTPPGVHLWDRENVEGVLEFREIVGSVRPVVERMRAEGADIVVVASHGGFEGSSYDPEVTGVAPENMGAAMAREIPGIDVIFLGHTHREVADSTIGGTLLLQAKNWGESLAVAELELEVRPGGGWRVASKRGMIRRPGAEVEPEVAGWLGEAHARTLAYVSQTVGRAEEEMTSRASRTRDTPILDFINEVQREAAGAELSSTAAFTLTARIPAGPVTVADIAGLYVYDNTLKAIRISGEQLRAYLEKSAEYYLPCPTASCDQLVNPDIPGYNFDAISGVDYVLDLSRPVGRRVVSLSRGGVPVQPTDSFTLALNNYRASGAGGFDMLANAPVVYDRGIEIRQLLIDEVQRQGVLDPDDYFEENWRIVPEALAERAYREQNGGAAPGTTSAAGAGGWPRLRILATNDFHGTLRPTRPGFADGREVGGAPALAAYFERAREEVEYPTILLDGGDVMQGTPISNLSQGRATVEYYNAVGYTAAALGNHEFDWGVETLKERVAQAEFAWLAANVFVKGTDTLPSWVEPTHTVRLAGCAAGAPACDSITVGIIGIATTETPRAAMPSFVAPFDFRDEAEAIDRWVPVLRAQGADFVIVTAHEGAYCAEIGSDDCSGPMMEIAERLAHRPDLIVSGHSHTVLDLTSGGVHIVQGGSYGTRFSVVDLERVTPDSVRVTVVDQPVTYVNEIEPDPGIERLVGRYEAEIGPKLYEVITTTSAALTRETPEHSLGNLIADAQRAATGSDVSIMNNGGIRIDLPAGPITYEDLFRLQPFANTLVTMDLTGAQLLDALEHTVARGVSHAHISGARVWYSPSAPDGERLVEARLEDGGAIEPARSYRVTANNFMVDGGDGYTMLAAGENITFTGIVDLDALIEYIRSLPRPLPVPEADRYIVTEP